MPRLPTITLLTDFGTRDTYVGQMKGVIESIAPGAKVVDLTHEVLPQDVTAGAAMLDDAVDVFPAGTIHVAVVDPGVGSGRHGVAVETQQFTFVGPDNGIFDAVLNRYPMRRAVTLANKTYQRDQVSATFHGRDVFSPAAAHLAAGVDLAALGEQVAELVKLDLPEPTIEGHAMRGEVLWVDHFGNLVTNIRHEDVQAWTGGGEALRGCGVWVQDAAAGEIGRTFSDAAVGTLVAYFGSSGRLEVAKRNGSAARQIGARSGSTVSVRNG